MNIERERRWLVRLEDIPAEVMAAPSEHITQGYLSPKGIQPLVRVRLIRRTAEEAPHRGVQTVKAPREDGMAEIEFDLEVGVAAELLSVSLAQLEKVRHTYPIEGALKYEVDFFQGKHLEGLVVVEIELPSFDYPLTVPAWFGPEITGVRELSNVSMAFLPILAESFAEAQWERVSRTRALLR